MRTSALQVDRFRVARRVPERKYVDDVAILVDGVNDPILSSTTDIEFEVELFLRDIDAPSMGNITDGRGTL